MLSSSWQVSKLIFNQSLLFNLRSIDLFSGDRSSLYTENSFTLAWLIQVPFYLPRKRLGITTLYRSFEKSLCDCQPLQVHGHNFTEHLRFCCSTFSSFINQKKSNLILLQVQITSFNIFVCLPFRENCMDLYIWLELPRRRLPFKKWTYFPQHCEAEGQWSTCTN